VCRPDRLHSVSPCLIKISSPMRSIMSPHQPP
jgi:hypothetical protein